MTVAPSITQARARIVRALCFVVVPMLSLLSSVLLLPLMTSHFGRQGLGSLTLGQSIGAFLSVAVALSWPTLGGDLVARAATAADRWDLYVRSCRTRLFVLFATASPAIGAAYLLSSSYRTSAALFVFGVSLNGLTAGWFYAGTGDGLRLAVNEGVVRLASYVCAAVCAELGYGLWTYPSSVIVGGAVSFGINFVHIARVTGAPTRTRHGSATTVRQTVAEIRQYGQGTVARATQALFSFGGATAFSALNSPSLSQFSAGDQLQKTAVNGSATVPFVAVQWVSESESTIARRSRIAVRWSVVFAVIMFAAWMVLSGALVRIIFAGVIGLSFAQRLAIGISFSLYYLARSVELLLLIPRGRSRLVFRTTTQVSLIGIVALAVAATIGVLAALAVGAAVSAAQLLVYVAYAYRGRRDVHMVSKHAAASLTSRTAARLDAA